MQLYFVFIYKVSFKFQGSPSSQRFVLYIYEFTMHCCVAFSIDIIYIITILLLLFYFTDYVRQVEDNRYVTNKQILLTVTTK